MISQPMEQRIFQQCLWLFAGIAILVLMSSCAPDPRKEAEAFATTTKAQQDALTQEQNRQHAEELFQLQKQQEILAYQMNAQLTQRLWSAIYITLTIVAVAAIILGGRSTIQAYEIVSVGLANAAVQRADIQSRLISLDPRTGQYPLLVEHIGKGIVTLTDPNTATVMQLDTRQDGDRLMIKGAMATRHTYVLSQAAARSEAPAGVSIIEAPSWKDADYDNQS
jgi:predicted NBD/HSP70 family sugar kinase